MQTKAIFFDAANTLVHKPGLYPAMMEVFRLHEIEVSLERLVAAHRFLSEVIVFPDSTSRSFYVDFNSHLLRHFGVIPETALLDDLFRACSYLPWAAFSDTIHMADLGVPLGVISNWSNSLSSELTVLENITFSWIFGSQDQRLRKPDPAFYRAALDSARLKAEEVIYVGDSLKLDIEPAMHLGLRAILIDRDNLYPQTKVPRITSLESLVELL